MPLNVSVAQLVEHSPFKRVVMGPSPIWRTSRKTCLFVEQYGRSNNIYLWSTRLLVNVKRFRLLHLAEARKSTVIILSEASEEKIQGEEERRGNADQLIVSRRWVVDFPKGTDYNVTQYYCMQDQCQRLARQTSTLQGSVRIRYLAP